ncbi:MAG TPA: NUDIX domain-containing protein [Chitinophagaceae bacterium]|nr:NUDIX domain-containing protein [Chitinophagaceae bacterium]
MYLKIYFGYKPLFLCDNVDEELQPYVHHDDAVFIDELNTHTIKAMIHEMEQPKIHAGVFYHPDLDELKKAFFKKFTVIQAAGGLVQNEKQEILLIFRRGSWDLPKGKLDDGEKLEDCAVREVEEETGLRDIKLIAPLTITYHTYHEGARFILKESHWYNMTTKGNQVLVPQVIEQITEVKWVAKKDLEKYIGRSFPSVADVLELHLTQ